MFKRINVKDIPPKRGTSPLTKAVQVEFSLLKKKLEDQPLKPGQAEYFVLDIQARPTSLKNATQKVFKDAQAFVEAKKLPYEVLTRTVENRVVLYVACPVAA